MARQTISSLTVSDNTKVTISLWFKIISYSDQGWSPNHAPGMFDIVAWGFQENDDDTLFAAPSGGAPSSLSWSSINVTPVTSGPNAGGATIGFRLASRYRAPVASGLDLPVAYYHSTAYPEIGLFCWVPSFDTSKWHHLMVAIDTSAPDLIHSGAPSAPSHVVSFTQGSKAGLRIDNVLYRATVGSPGSDSFVPSDTDGISLSSGPFSSAARYNWSQPTNDTFGVDAPYPTDYDTGFTSIAFNGLEFSMPGLSAFDGFQDSVFNEENNNLVIAYGDFYCWVGKYINPTFANVSKLWNIKGTTASPAKTASVISAYGTPTILYSGKASGGSATIKFSTNQGTAGQPAQSGTVTDYTPTPSHGV